MYAIQINNNPRCLVHKTDTFKNLKAVNNGRSWAGKWYGCVKTAQTTFATRENAEAELARLSTLTNLGRCFTEAPTYTIIEL